MTGTYGTTTRWDKISSGYISHAYVSSTGTVPTCATPPLPASAVTRTVNAAKAMVGRYPYSYAAGNYYGATVGVNNGHPEDTYTVGFDCSGLMEYAFYQGAGIKLNSTSVTQYQQGQANGWLVPLAQRRAGDMVFGTNNGGVSGIHHVALLVDAGTRSRPRATRSTCGSRRSPQPARPCRTWSGRSASPRSQTPPVCRGGGPTRSGSACPAALFDI